MKEIVLKNKKRNARTKIRKYNNTKLSSGKVEKLLFLKNIKLKKKKKKFMAVEGKKNFVEITTTTENMLMHLTLFFFYYFLINFLRLE